MNTIKFNVRVKIFIYLFLIIGISLNAKSVNANLVRKIYHDGLYDAYSQIENSIEMGIVEKKINMFKNKYIVYKDIKSIPFVDILLLRTIATKNNLDKTLVVKDKHGDKFIIFGGYSRKADAVFISKRLSEDGVDTQIKLNQEIFQNDAVIAKKFLNDIKNMLSDMPIKVIEISKIIYKNNPAPTTKCSEKKDYLREIKNKKPIAQKIIKEHKKNSAKIKNLYFEFKDIKRDILRKKYSLVKAKGTLALLQKDQNKIIPTGSRIGKNFTLYKITVQGQNQYKIILKGNNKLFYVVHLATKEKGLNKKEAKETTSVVKVVKVKKAEKQKNVSIPQSNKYICDFNKLTTFSYSLEDGYRQRLQKVSELSYKGKAKITLFDTQEKNNSVFVRIGGENTKTFYIRKVEFKHACKVL